MFDSLCNSVGTKNEIPLTLHDANNKTNKTLVKLIDTQDITAAQEDAKIYMDLSKTEPNSKLNNL